MYVYHDSTTNKERLEQGICRCQSPDEEVYNLRKYLADGRIRDPRDQDKSLSTPRIQRSRSDPLPPDGGPGKTFIFAVNEAYEIHIARDGVRRSENAVKHETLFHNADVLAAGEIWIHKGIIMDLNDFSGSYIPPNEMQNNPHFSASILEAFQKLQLEVDASLRRRLTGFSLPSQ